MISFSIITCTFNAQDVLQRTLDSVAQQTYKNIEHLIIDGVSRDETLSMAHAYEAKINSCSEPYSIKIVSERDKGLYDAMNKAIQLASNDYIVFMNAGDTFKDIDTLKTIASSVKEGELLPGVLYGDTDIVDMEGKFLRKRHLQTPQTLTSNSFKHGMLVCHQAFYALTSIAKTTPYDLQYRFSADVDWCIRIMKKSEQEHRALRNVNAIVANFLDGGLTTANHRASLKERFRVMCYHYGCITTTFMHLWFAIRNVLKR